MTDQFVTQPRVITPLTAQILRHMLAEPRADYYVRGLAEALGNPGASITPRMRDLKEAGWVTSRMDARSAPHGAPRRNFKFTKAGERAARAELKDWTFTD